MPDPCASSLFYKAAFIDLLAILTAIPANIAILKIQDIRLFNIAKIIQCLA